MRVKVTLRCNECKQRNYNNGLGIGGVAAATAIALFLSWICSIF